MVGYATHLNHECKLKSGSLSTGVLVLSQSCNICVSVETKPICRSADADFKSADGISADLNLQIQSESADADLNLQIEKVWVNTADVSTTPSGVRERSN